MGQSREPNCCRDRPQALALRPHPRRSRRSQCNPGRAFCDLRLEAPSGADMMVAKSSKMNSLTRGDEPRTSQFSEERIESRKDRATPFAASFTLLSSLWRDAACDPREECALAERPSPASPGRRADKYRP